MPKLSIIVPVYNAEKELKKSVDSILAQTEKDIEIILVDDGSADNSGNICDEYAVKDTRVRVIHQKNAGVSAARNAGIDVAAGEYIGFVDADDWIEPKMYERLYSEAIRTTADIVMCDAVTVCSGGNTQADTITQLPSDTVLQKADFTPPLLLEMAGSVWRCIYRSGLISSCGLRFPLGVKFSEDRIFNIYSFGQANMVCYIKEGYYNRYINTKSAVHRFHEDYFEAYKTAADEIEKAVRYAWDNSQTLQKAYYGQFIAGAFGAICNFYYKTSTLSRKEKKDKVKKLCDDDKLRMAINRFGADRKSRLILEKKYSLLIAYAKLANFKHGR